MGIFLAVCAILGIFLAVCAILGIFLAVCAILGILLAIKGGPCCKSPIFWIHDCHYYT